MKCFQGIYLNNSVQKRHASAEYFSEMSIQSYLKLCIVFNSILGWKWHKKKKLGWVNGYSGFLYFRTSHQCNSRRSKFFFFLEGDWLVGYCMMIEITQMALSYYLNKQRKDCFLQHLGLNDPESAARARGAICWTVQSVQMIQTTKCATRPGDFLWMAVRIWDCLCCHKTPSGCDAII